MIHTKIHLISRGCLQLSIALQCSVVIVAYNTIWATIHLFIHVTIHLFIYEEKAVPEMNDIFIGNQIQSLKDKVVMQG